jgi:exodeoxyribonuclease X
VTVFRIIDTETCGFDGGIVEIASVDIIGNEIENPMSDFVKPDRRIEFSAMAIHHITEDIVKDKHPIELVCEKYKGSDYLVAHNATFDKGVLPDMGADWICTRKLAAKIWPDLASHSNQFLRYALDIKPWVPENLHAHRALYDCYVTAGLFLRIIQTTNLTIQDMLEISSRPVLLRTVHIGKYRGKTYEEVAKLDPGWLRWALSNIKDMSEDMNFTIKHHLTR